MGERRRAGEGVATAPAAAYAVASNPVVVAAAAAAAAAAASFVPPPLQLLPPSLILPVRQRRQAGACSHIDAFRGEQVWPGLCASAWSAHAREDAPDMIP